MYEEIEATIAAIKKDIEKMDSRLTPKHAKIPPKIMRTISLILIGNAALILLGMLLISSIATWLVIDLIVLLTNFCIGSIIYVIVKR